MKEELLDGKQVEYKIDYKDEKAGRGLCTYLASIFFVLAILSLFGVAFMEMYYYRCSNRQETLDCRSGLCLLLSSSNIVSIASSDVELKKFVSNINRASSKYNINVIFIPAEELVYLQSNFQAISESFHRFGISLVATNVPLSEKCDGSEPAETINQTIWKLLPFLDGLVLNSMKNVVCTDSAITAAATYIREVARNQSASRNAGNKEQIKIYVEIVSTITADSTSSQQTYQPKITHYSYANLSTLVNYHSLSTLPSVYDLDYDSEWGTVMIHPDMMKIESSFGDYRDYFNLLFFSSIFPDVKSVLDDAPEFLLGLQYFKNVSQIYNPHNFTRFGFFRRNDHIVVFGTDLPNRATLSLCFPTVADSCNTFLANKITEGHVIGTFNRLNFTFPVGLSGGQITLPSDLLPYHAVFALSESSGTT